MINGTHAGGLSVDEDKFCNGNTNQKFNAKTNMPTPIIIGNLNNLCTNDALANHPSSNKPNPYIINMFKTVVYISANNNANISFLTKR